MATHRNMYYIYIYLLDERYIPEVEMKTIYKTVLNSGVGACLPMIPFSQSAFISASVRIGVFLVVSPIPS